MTQGEAVDISYKVPRWRCSSKQELPPKRISAFIEEAIRARLRPDKTTLDATYRQASAEPWRRKLSADVGMGRAKRIRFFASN